MRFTVEWTEAVTYAADVEANSHKQAAAMVLRGDHSLPEQIQSEALDDEMLVYADGIGEKWVTNLEALAELHRGDS